MTLHKRLYLPTWYFNTVPTGNKTALPPDGARRGMLGDYKLDITNSVRIMDKDGNPIYNIPYYQAKCSMHLGALSIRHAGKRVLMRGRDAKAWLRAIQHLQSPWVWYMCEGDECELLYGKKVLGVTPCVLVPPFSWQAFQSGSYNITVRRPGAKERTEAIPAAPGIYTIRCREGSPPTREGIRPIGKKLVLNPQRSLVMSNHPYLTDGRGVAMLVMPGAEASVGLMKRKATISWNQPGLGRLTIDVKCDASLKYDRLQELLPQKNDGKKDARLSPVRILSLLELLPQKNDGKKDGIDHVPPIETRSAPQRMGSKSYKNVQFDAPRKKVSRGSGSKWNRGNYNGTDLYVTKTDLETHMNRFDGYTFEAVCANLLASMGYHIVKGYDVKSGRMLGATTSDKGVDIIAKKGKDRIIVQCKLWQEQCGGPDVNKTLGAATTQKGTSVLMIASGGFTAQAKQIAKESSMNVYLWDWDMLHRNIRKHLMRYTKPHARGISKARAANHTSTNTTASRTRRDMHGRRATQ